MNEGAESQGLPSWTTNWSFMLRLALDMVCLPMLAIISCGFVLTVVFNAIGQDCLKYSYTTSVIVLSL